ncbi:hypothetical protein AKJ66_01155 [candidate division MSBL1 archaeon SCGC-AAA259E22]|uniref:Uncharacterized protein n=1 Tax=candidate division MSBL1 archaeon SCGC-AAA259E22 TaxID=1698265 RepID=A0A133UHR7_9EURY|nr:hypothetical protein AKJ66_01155 [candidate division MSBL1 archaeon SCGC-AAA259E22]
MIGFAFLVLLILGIQYDLVDKGVGIRDKVFWVWIIGIMVAWYFFSLFGLVGVLVVYYIWSNQHMKIKKIHYTLTIGVSGEGTVSGIPQQNTDSRG